MGCGVRRTGHHSINDVIVHQHRSEVGDVGNDLAGLLECHALILAHLGILSGEVFGKFIGSRVNDNRGAEVDTEFCCSGTYLRLLAENRQIGQTATQQPTRRLQDPVIVALGKHDALAVGTRSLHQAVGEHLRCRHRRDGDREPGQHVGNIDIPLHQFDRGIDLAL